MSACAEQHPQASESLYIAPAWPAGSNLNTQKDVAKYVVRGKAAYDSCVVNLETMKMIQSAGQ